MKCWISPYELESAGELSARTERRIYRGILMRVGSGFACLHPWPELGDPTLEECLQDLAGARKTNIVRRALVCAAIDGRAREEGVSLFDGVQVPDSHFLMPEISEECLEEAVERGFSVVKVKGGRDIPGEMEKIRLLGIRWPELKWRIDFNDLGSCEDLRRILSKWDDEELSRIDFLEDPSPYEVEEWRTLPVAVANDRRSQEDDGQSEVLVVKPAVEEIPVKADQRIVVTSYLDHPLGQCFAAYKAGEWGIREICGLQSHGVFDSNPFSEEMGGVKPEFQVQSGEGLGFSELLENLSWRSI